ncbi:MAG: hypothetical protein QW474_00495 [Candidatus Aenigmatarchaeota archaeon]
MTKFLSRKLFVILIAISLIAVGFFMNKLTGDQFVWGLCGLVATYITGNAVVNFSNSKKNGE